MEIINKCQVITNKETTIKDQDKINKETIIKEIIKEITKEIIKETIKETIKVLTTTKDPGMAMVTILITMDSTDLTIQDNTIMLLVQMDQEVFLINLIKVHQVDKEEMEEKAVMEDKVIAY